ncbi:MAG: hypothetical protein ACLPY2_18740 [Bryobacteraceae bacterium]|jgi:hypothetical protein
MPHSPVIHVPKPARSSYQPQRPLSRSTLLQSQVKHFRDLEKDLPLDQQTGIAIDSIITEAQAAEYIRRMTNRFHRPPGGA